MQCLIPWVWTLAGSLGPAGGREDGGFSVVQAESQEGLSCPSSLDRDAGAPVVTIITPGMKTSKYSLRFTALGWLQSSSWFTLSACSRVWLTQLAWATIHPLSMSAWLTEKRTFIPPKHRVLFFHYL